MAGSWHIDRIAGLGFLAASMVGMLVHSAGWWRLERDRDPSRGGEP